MRKMKLQALSACALLTLVAMGCHTLPKPVAMDTQAVVPTPPDTIIVDDVILIADVSGSMQFCQKFTTMKTLVEGFVQTMPEGHYNAGLFSFGGEWQIDWLRHPVQPFDRLNLGSAAARIDHLRGSTYMTEALHQHRGFANNKTGRTAVVIFSDGKARNPETALDAIRGLDARHLGELCVYTVQLCYEEEGAILLRDMASATGCGFTTHGEAITGPAGMQELVSRIFFGPGATRYIDEPSSYGAILFDSGKAYLRPEYAALVDQVAALAKHDPSLRLHLEGHTDNSGSESANVAISKQRATAVKNALIERGVSADAITTEGVGSAKPAYPNDSAANRKLNRRVVIRFID